MTRYITGARMAADLLSAAKTVDRDGNGVSVTILLKKCNISYSRMKQLLSSLVSAGLIDERSDGDGDGGGDGGGGGKHSRYFITENGLKFLEVYGRLMDSPNHID